MIDRNWAILYNSGLKKGVVLWHVSLVDLGVVQIIQQKYAMKEPLGFMKGVL
jgi:hypothetical protein